MALVPIAFFDLGAAALIGLMGLSGFFNGVLQPSRDMIVRAVTPPGAFGRVFGFVTTGFNIGGVIAPPAFGYLMDNGEPRLVILGVALCALMSIPTVMITVAQRAQKRLKPRNSSIVANVPRRGCGRNVTGLSDTAASKRRRSRLLDGGWGVWGRMPVSPQPAPVLRNDGQSEAECAAVTEVPLCVRVCGQDQVKQGRTPRPIRRHRRKFSETRDQ